MTTDVDPVEPAKPIPRTPGDRLREAREGLGLSLDEIAARTRVPLRQLEAIEQGNYATLPSITYSVGFAKAYARAVGLDEVVIGRDVRSQNTHQPPVRRTEYVAYEPDEPKREPTGLVAVIGVALALLLLLAAGLWFGTTWFRGDGAAPAPTSTADAAQGAVPEAPAVPIAAQGGQVTLTANDDVWMRIYDRQGNTVYENTLKPGESYAVPQDNPGLMINVGRPDKLTVTINGSAAAPLGDGKVAIKDVPISATALRARGKPTATTLASPIAAATSSATPAKSSRPTPKPTPRHRDAAPGDAGVPALNIAAPATTPAAPPAAQPTPAP